MEPLFGIDLGGTKIEGVVMAGEEQPETLARIRIGTEASQGYGHILGRVKELFARLKLETGDKPHRIGIGTPGSANPATGLMRNCNTTCLNGKPFQKDLEQELGLEVRLSNDANCFALAEALWGAGRGYETVFGVIMGTGVGGGLVVRGQVLDGANGIAGEWGHNVLDPAGPMCYCGKAGCVETFLSGPANELAYERAAGRSMPLREIVERARTGTDILAHRQLDLLKSYFGRAIAEVVNIYDPHAIILGGGVGRVAELRMEGPNLALPWVFSDRFETPFLEPHLGDSAGVYGAALLAK